MHSKKTLEFETGSPLQTKIYLRPDYKSTLAWILTIGVMILDKLRQIRIVAQGIWLLLYHIPCSGATFKWTIKNYSIQYAKSAEPDSITLLSDDVACRGGDPILTLTGNEISWYADPGKKVFLAKGNTYHSASLDKTSTFYLTRRVNGIESEVKAITIKIVEAILVDVKTTLADCGKMNGSIIVASKGGTSKYPVKYQLNEGLLQAENTFRDLAPGIYKLTLQAAKCFGSIEVTIAQHPPTIVSIDSVAPRCGKKDGSLRIAGFGGSGTLSYSLNGIDFFAYLMCKSRDMKGHFG